jgi:P27 family predicted phage terminase small subunit
MAPVRPPAGLSREALAVWRRIAPELIEKRVLTAWDVDTFGHYCEAVVIARQARKELGSGEITKQSAAGHVRNPAFMVWRDAVAEIKRLGSLFGLNPSSRASLTVEPGSGGSNELDVLTPKRVRGEGSG